MWYIGTYWEWALARDTTIKFYLKMRKMPSDKILLGRRGGGVLANTNPEGTPYIICIKGRGSKLLGVGSTPRLTYMYILRCSGTPQWQPPLGNEVWAIIEGGLMYLRGVLLHCNTSVLPSIPKACRPNKPSVQNSL